MDVIQIEYLIITIAAFAAFYIKGLMGVGTTTVLLSILALAIDPKLAIVLAAFANIFGGAAMLKIDPLPLNKKFWIPIAVSLFISSIIGAMALKYVPNDIFTIILGVGFLCLSVWFIWRVPNAENIQDGTPEKATPLDVLIGTIAGFCGGFIGINVIIKVLYFGRKLNKRYMRRFFVIVYFPAAIAQTLTYVANGLFTQQILLYGFFMLPGLIFGIYLGNKAHYKISELWFRRILGAFLFIVSLKLIL